MKEGPRSNNVARYINLYSTAQNVEEGVGVTLSGNELALSSVPAGSYYCPAFVTAGGSGKIAGVVNGGALVVASLQSGILSGNFTLENITYFGSASTFITHETTTATTFTCAAGTYAIGATFTLPGIGDFNNSLLGIAAAGIVLYRPMVLHGAYFEYVTAASPFTVTFAKSGANSFDTTTPSFSANQKVYIWKVG